MPLYTSLDLPYLSKRPSNTRSSSSAPSTPNPNPIPNPNPNPYPCHSHIALALALALTLPRCPFDSWLLATNNKENMLQWAASLHAAQPSEKKVRVRP